MNNIKGMSYKVKLFSAVTSIVLVVALSACSENKSAQEYISSANEFKNEHNYTSALLELKNAVRQAPKNAQYRKALGDIHLALGNYLDAEKELEKARELGIEFAEVSSGLAKTYASLDKSSRSYELVDEGAALTEDKYLTLLLYAGITALNNGELERAHDLLDQAMVFDKKYAQVKLAQAYSHYSKNEYDKGLAVLSLLEADGEFYFDKVLIEGFLYFAKKNYVSAKEKFIEFREETPNNSKVTLYIINSLLHSKDFEEAEKYTDEYLFKYPNSSLALFYRSKLEYQREEYSSAQINAERALQQNSELYAARGVAGLSAFHLEKYERADAHLRSLASHVSENSPLHAILRAIKIKLGLPLETSDSLDLPLQDIQTLVGASDELIQLGHISEAKKILSDFDVDNGNESKQLSDIGLLKLALGEDEGFEFLEKAIEKEPSLHDLRMALAMSYYKSDQFERAINVVKEWQLAYSNNVDAYNFMAMLLLKVNDIDGAETQFDKTLQLEPSNDYARLYFANKDFNNNLFSDALRKTKDILNDSPENFNALSIYFNLGVLNGNTADAVSRIKAAYLNDIDNHVKKYFFAQVLYITKDFEQAIEVLTSWDLNNIDIPRNYFVLLVASHTKLKSFNEALKVNELWLENRPTDNVAWFSKLSILDKLDDLPQALSTVKSMLLKFPHWPRLKVLLPHYQILNKQFANAKKSLDAVEVNEANETYIEGLYGQILLSEASYEKALPKLERQYIADPNSRSAGFVYTSMLKLNKNSAALDFMRQHLQSFPNDLVTKSFYGQTLLDSDLGEAKKTYQELVAALPDNFVYLNNLAWVEYSLENYSEAKLYAEKANNLSPEQAIILDTLSRIYFKLGAIDLAKDASEKALKLAPNNKSILSNYKVIRGS